MKQPDPERVRELADKASRLGQLKDQPGWDDLREIVDREEKRYFDKQMRVLRDGEPVDQTDVKAHALAFDLIRYLLAHPEKAEASLQSALRKAELFAGLQEEEVTVE